MPRYQKKRDLSKQSSNPTSELQKSYQQLMAIEDPEELMKAAISVVEPLVGSGISETNYRKFINDIRNAARKGTNGIQFFLSNYILKGSGLGVDLNSIQSIASYITEDANEICKLTPQQQYLKNLVESCTKFNVSLILY